MILLQVDRNSIIIGKLSYIVLISIIFNLLFSLFSILNSQVFEITNFVLNTSIAVVIGLVFFWKYLFSSFEKFLKMSQYLRYIIIFSIIILSRLLKGYTSFMDKINLMSPLILGALIIIAIYFYYKQVLKRFTRYSIID